MGSFYVTRPHARKAGHATGEWLKGQVARCDAAEEALSLLTDPRDTIVGVYYWNDRHNQFDGKWTRHDRRHAS
jgi:hypothetical protein